MSNLFIKSTDRNNTHITHQPAVTDLQNKATFESAIERRSKSSSSQYRAKENSLNQQSQTSSQNEQDPLFLQAKQVTAHSQVKPSRSENKAPVSPLILFKLVNTKQTTAPKLPLPPTQENLRSQLKSVKTQLAIRPLQSEAQSQQLAIHISPAAYMEIANAKFKRIPQLLAGKTTTNITDAQQTSGAEISTALNRLPATIAHIQKWQALEESASLTSPNLSPNAEATNGAIVPFTPGDHLLAPLKTDDLLLTSTSPTLSDLIEQLTVEIYTTITQQGADAKFQIQLPQFGILDINITTHAGELQIAIQSMPETQKQLLRSHNELLERLQRLNPAQNITLNFSSNSSFEGDQGSRQRRHVYDEWEHNE